jgi:predicted small lipoprotein YifL
MAIVEKTKITSCGEKKPLYNTGENVNTANIKHHMEFPQKN